MRDVCQLMIYLVDMRVIHELNLLDLQQTTGPFTDFTVSCLLKQDN